MHNVLYFSVILPFLKNRGIVMIFVNSVAVHNYSTLTLRSNWQLIALRTGELSADNGLIVK